MYHSGTARVCLAIVVILGFLGVFENHPYFGWSLVALIGLYFNGFEW